MSPVDLSRSLLRVMASFLLSVPMAHALEGDGLFGAHCARCHSDNEMITRLRTDWQGVSAGALLDRISATMPAEAPGSLQPEEYRAIVGAVLASAGIDVPSGVRLEEVAVSSPALVAPRADVEWRHHSGGLNANRYVALADIHAGNAAELEIAWRWSAANFGPTPEIRNVSMPIMRDGRLFLGAGATRNIVAIDAASGQTLWMWRPEEGERFDRAARKDSGKGVAYYEAPDGAGRVIAVTPGYQLVSLNAKTGLPDPQFGDAGLVDLSEGLRRAPDRPLDIGLTVPPLVVGDVIIVGSAHAVSFRPPSKANVKGDVRAFDARTGEKLWTFHTIPEPGEPGADTWLNGSASFTGNAGVWAPMSADPELGMVYLPVESATGDQYGGDRPGGNLFSSSLVAVDLATGSRRWHFQHAHHDIWDWDTAVAPVLADLPDGRRLVVLLTKQADTFVFDRATGQPLWPIEERPAPASDVPGEWTSPTQPRPTLPLPFDRQGVTRSDLIDYTPEIRAEVDRIIQSYRLGPLYQPPSLAEAADGTRGTLRLPSSTGGANWEGSAFDPLSGLLYVPSRTQVEVMSLVHDPKASDIRFISGRVQPPRVFGLPIAKPPWGRITAIDLNTGEHVWMIANGDTPQAVAAHSALNGVKLGRTGKPTRAGILVTDTLLFAGEGFGGDPVFRAHDKLTGEIVAEIELPAAQAGPPSSYRVRGKQYLVMMVADGSKPAELIALALPD
jgi:quinoprotein glucose dehydrogenase